MPNASPKTLILDMEPASVLSFLNVFGHNAVIHYCYFNVHQALCDQMAKKKCQQVFNLTLGGGGEIKIILMD